MIANVFTGLRILCSLLMLLPPVFSPLFYVLYAICGISDMIDGRIARKAGSASRFGERFDTAADGVFLLAASIKLLPVLPIPVWLWTWIIAIACIKLVNILSGCIRKSRVLLPHTRLNKTAGFMLYLLPLTLPFLDFRCSAAIVSVVLTIAALDEIRYVHPS